MAKFNESIQLIGRSLKRFLSLSLVFASMVLMVRIYELVIVSNLANYPSGSFSVMLKGLWYDLIIYLQISAVLMIPYLIVALFSQRVAHYVYTIISILLIIGDILLIKYFSVARVPLGSDLLGYSMAEIKQTIGSSGELKIWPLVLLLLFVAYMLRVMILHVYLKLKPWMMSILVLLMFGSFMPIKQLSIDPTKYDSEFSMFAANNKLGFFAESMTSHYLHKGALNQQSYTFKVTTTSKEGNPFTYINQEYPLLHNETTPNVLGEYFNLGQTPPNIVLIVVESLGRSYSGPNALLGSFTPHLDSLMQKSLYWENCVSTSGRTFQVLPSTLASLPFGEKGFAEMGDQMPDHLSLISILKKQAGYSSSFTYGGEARFDNMDIFMRRQGADSIIDSRSFGAEYSRLEASAEGFSWGYGDREIFKRYLSELKTSTGKPRIDVMLTLAMHSPFQVPDQAGYERKVSDRLFTLNLTDQIKSFDQQYIKQLATVMYFDDAIKYFFDEMSKTTEYANTIFIITGDHRMPEIPISTQLDRFHVPLVVYSPMLKKAEKFSSVVSHFDLTPSLLAMFDAQKFVKRPTVASWMGHGLDTSVAFRSLQTYPLMRNKNEIMDMLNGTNFLSGQTGYLIMPNMDIEPVNDDNLQQKMREELDNYIRMNNYACKNNKLIPDSLKTYYQ